MAATNESRFFRYFGIAMGLIYQVEYFANGLVACDQDSFYACRSAGYHIPLTVANKIAFCRVEVIFLYPLQQQARLRLAASAIAGIIGMVPAIKYIPYLNAMLLVLFFQLIVHLRQFLF